MSTQETKQLIKQELPYLLAIVFVYILFVIISWDKCGILSSIDQSRELLISYLISSGKVLYKDIFYIYGPLPQYFIVFFIKIFGYSFTLYRVIGIGLCLIFLILYYVLSRVVLNTTYSALLVLFSIPALLFNDYGAYIFPYSFNVLFASLFFMCTVLLLIKYLDTSKNFYLYIACLVAALLLFTKQEYFVYNIFFCVVMILFIHLFKLDLSEQKTLLNKLSQFVKTIPYAQIAKLMGFVILFILPGFILCSFVFGYDNFINGLMPLEFALSKEHVRFTMQENLSIFTIQKHYKFFLLTAFIPVFLLIILTRVLSLLLYVLHSKEINKLYLYLILIVIVSVFGIPLFNNNSLISMLLMHAIQYSKYIFSGFNLWLVILFFYLLFNFKPYINQKLFIITFAALLVSTRSFLNMELTSYALFYLPFTLILFVYLFSEVVPKIFKTSIMSKKNNNWDSAFQVVLIVLISFYSYITISSFICNKYKVETPQGTHYVFNEALDAIHHKYLEIGKFIKDNTSKNDTILVYPADSLIYIYANRLPASRHYHLFPGTVHSVKIEKDIIEEIKANKPALILLSNYNFLKNYNIGEFGKDNYNVYLHKWITLNYKQVKKIPVKGTGLVFDVYTIKK